MLSTRFLEVFWPPEKKKNEPEYNYIYIPNMFLFLDIYMVMVPPFFACLELIASFGLPGTDVYSHVPLIIKHA